MSGKYSAQKLLDYIELAKKPTPIQKSACFHFGVYNTTQQKIFTGNYDANNLYIYPGNFSDKFNKDAKFIASTKISEYLTFYYDSRTNKYDVSDNHSLSQQIMDDSIFIYNTVEYKLNYSCQHEHANILTNEEHQKIKYQRYQDGVKHAEKLIAQFEKEQDKLIKEEQRQKEQEIIDCL